MKKKISAIAAFAAALLTTATAAQAFDPCHDAAHYMPIQERHEKSFLFKVEKCGQPVSYILGTVHLARPEIIRSADGAVKLLDEVEEAGFEIAEPIDKKMTDMFGHFMMMPKGESLKEKIGAKQYRKLADLLGQGHGTPRMMEMLDHVRPWAASIMLELAGERNGLALDEQIKRAALKKNMKVFGLEKAEEQLKIFQSLSEDLQLQMLKDSIDHHDDMVKLKEDIVRAYLDHDIGKIELLEEHMLSAGEDKKLSQWMHTHMIAERNVKMKKRMLKHLKEHSSLLSLGALHLVGAGGVLAMLEKDGYFITPIPQQD